MAVSSGALATASAGRTRRRSSWRSAGVTLRCARVSGRPPRRADRPEDGLGSVRAVTDRLGTKVAGLDYAPYGAALGTSFDNVPGGEAMRFVGSLGVRYDAATGLHYMRNRWYDLTLGRFVSRDPVGNAAAPYNYANGNPQVQVDPLGLDWYNPFTWSKSTVDKIGAIGEMTLGAVTAAAGTSGQVGGTLLAIPTGGSSTVAIPVGTALQGAGAGMMAHGLYRFNNARQEAPHTEGGGGGSYHEHHNLPQRFREDFNRLGINIDDPQYKTLVDATDHLSFSPGLTADFKAMFQEWAATGHKPTAKELLDFARVMAKKRGICPNF